MAAKTYYSQHALSVSDQDQQHLLAPSISSPGFAADADADGRKMNVKREYRRFDDGQGDLEDLDRVVHRDAALKSRIRHLRIISRTLAFFLSIAVLIPITITLVKFLSTQNTYRTITDPSTGALVSRTAWAKDSRVWPTWAYFGVAAISVVLNFAVLFSYKFGTAKANVASYVTSTFSWVVMAGNAVVWCVAAGLYRGEKDKGGKSDDLWGWTCSAGARAIQREFGGEVDYRRFCNVQSVSWYIGLVQAGSALLTIVIYVLVLRRKKSKKVLQHQLQVNGFQGMVRH